MFRKSKENFIKKGLNLLLILAMLVTMLPFSGNIKAKAEEDIRVWLNSKKPLYAGYYRTWHDSSSMLLDDKGEVVKGGGKVQMGDIPAEVDLVFMFDDGQAKDSPFYDKVKDEYVPKLHERGQKIIRTLGVEHLNGGTGLSKDSTKYPDNEEGYKKLAEDIIEEYVTKLGLDGLDIDIEKHNYSETEQDLKNLKEIFGIDPEVQRAKNKRAENVFRELAKLIGPNGKDKSKLLIIDTTMPAESTILKQNYDNIDLFLVQRYGKTGELGNPNLPGTHSFLDLDGLWNSLKNYIPANKFMIGFSFYEERSPKGNRWYDIPFKDGTSFDAKHENKIGNGIKDSRAGRYALWQPKDGGLKGGIFSYAVERDGVYHPYKEDEEVTNNPEIDTWCETEFKQSIELKQIMLNAQGELITEADFADEALRESIIAQVGRFKGDLERFDGELKLDNPEIKDTTGLSLLVKVKKITIKGLVSLENLNLKNCGLETIDIADYENYKKLKNIDISGNKLDLSAESPDRKTLDKLMENNPTATVEYGDQEPKPYPDYALENLPDALDKASEEFDLGDILTVTKTVRGTNIEQLADLKINEKDVIKTGYVINPWNYSGYTFKIVKHDQTVIAGNKINREEDATYKVTVLDANGDKVTEKMVKVGEGKEFLENLSYKAKIVWQSKPCTDNENNNSINYLFDDNLNNDRPKLFSSDRLLKFIIDIGENVEVKHIDFYNDTRLSAESVDFEAIKDNNVDTGKFNFQYCSNKDNSTKVKTFDLKDVKEKYSEGIDTSESRYWIITFNGTFMGMWAQEIKLLGTLKTVEPPKPEEPEEPQQPEEPQKPEEPQNPIEPQQPVEPQNPGIVPQASVAPVVPYTASPNVSADKKPESKEEPKNAEVKEIETTNDETPQGTIAERTTVFTKNKLSYKLINEASNLIKMLKADKTPKKLIIPASITKDGKTFKVSELENKAFKGKKQLTTVSFGKNISKIGKECFAGCTNLKVVEFKGNKVKSIGKDAFKGTGSKITVKVPVNMSKKDRAKLKKMLIKAKISKKVVIK